MIVSGGENVFPKEVEDVLACHAAVAEAAAIGVEDEKVGQRVRAFVVRGGGLPATEEDLKEHVKANLALHGSPGDRVRRRAAPSPDREGAQARAAEMDAASRPG